jgi:tetratricopeptide (TPR) repeat protein
VPVTASRQALVLGAGALAALTLVAYVPAIEGGFVWDDDAYVAANPRLESLDGLRRIWLEPAASYPPQYYPLTYTTFWLERRLWGVEPAGYHLVNVLLHALNAVLLWRILGLLAVPGAWVAAAVFALHPVHVESVAWVTERKNVLSGACYLGAALAYLRFALPAATARWGWYALAVVLFVAALLAKTVACTLPAALLLVVWWKRGRIGLRDVAPLVPFFALAVPFGLATAWMEKHRGGALGPEWVLTAAERCLVAGRALWFYLGKLLWPRSLAFIYPRWQLDATAWWQWAFPAAAVGVIVGLWVLRGRLGRGPVVAALFFAGTLAPALGFFDVYPMRFSFVADHFVYLASVGPIALGVAAAVRAGVGRAGAVVLLAVLGMLVWRQGRVYGSLETLWVDTLAKNAGAWLAHNNLGVLRFEAGRAEEALAHYRAALAVKPDCEEAHNNLGNALVRAGRTAEALAHYEEALRIRPAYAEVHVNIGSAFEGQGNADEAIAHYRRALEVEPAYADAHYKLANALAGQGRSEEAIAHYAEALAIRPAWAEARNNLGNALVQLGRRDEALAQWAEAVRIRPAYAEAHYNIANRLAEAGRREEAVAHYERALEARPDWPEAHNNLGIALAASGRHAGAIAHYVRAVQLRPAYPEAHYNLGLALLGEGRIEEAVVHYREALRLRPGWRPALSALAVAQGQPGATP